MLCAEGDITYVAGISPKRRIVVLTNAVGIFDEEGQTMHDGCYGLGAAHRYTVIQIEP